jgi:HAD superfamily 5'-nucleotidase-like hydrolase
VATERDRIDRVHANSYVDLGLVTTVGFDYDYTIVQYNDELLSLIYNIAKEKLVRSNDYPEQILDLSYDPSFSIRGLAVDRKTGWICHLSLTHKVAIAYEGRRKVSRERIRGEFSNKRSLTPNERQKRLKPLNDLFSMAECSLVADVIETFIKDGTPYHAPSVVNDVLKVIGETHLSFEFHRAVKKNPAKYLVDMPGMKEVLDEMKASGKNLLLVSNSPFWFVNAGMNFILGENWREYFECVVAEAGKPSFYTDNSRPFREVNTEDKWETKSFAMVDNLEPGKVYGEQGGLGRYSDIGCKDEKSSSNTLPPPHPHTHPLPPPPQPEGV